MRYLFILFVLVFASVQASAGIWSYGSPQNSLLDPNVSSVQIAVGTSVAQQQAIATTHGYPNSYVFSPGTSCPTMGQVHRYYSVTWVPTPAPLRPARYGVIRFYSQVCGFS